MQNFIQLKIITIDTFNFRLKKFDFGCKNKPDYISMGMLENRKVKFTAAEMLHFTLNFPLIVGDLVPVKTDEWSLILLEEYAYIQEEYAYYTPKLFKSLVIEHHTIFINLFGKCLKFKAHILLHYAAIMLKVGPLKNKWSMRFEAKHQTLKKN